MTKQKNFVRSFVNQHILCTFADDLKANITPKLLRNMGNIQALPALGIVEALKLAASRILDFKGRSRRSEFWWCIAVALLLQYALGYLTFLSSPVQIILDALIMACALSVTARRLHDGGYPAIWVFISYALGLVCLINMTFGKIHDFFVAYAEKAQHLKSSDLSQLEILREQMLEEYADPLLTFYILTALWGISSLVVFCLCLLDSKQAPNKYGPSPKYVERQENPEHQG